MGTRRGRTQRHPLLQTPGSRLPRAHHARPAKRRRSDKVHAFGRDAMKRGGILHPGLNHLLASTGHTDYFTICDRGFPVPDGPERIDLALVDDIPTIIQVLKAIAAEYQIDRVVIANEMIDVSPMRV